MAKNDPLAALARFTRVYRQGAVIFREGEPGDRMYFILEGSVRITRSRGPAGEAGANKGKITLATLGAGEFFGEMSVFTGQPRSGTAEALTEVKLLALNRQEAEIVIKARPELAMRLIETLCRRLEAADACLAQEAGAARQENRAQGAALVDKGSPAGEVVEGQLSDPGGAVPGISGVPGQAGTPGGGSQAPVLPPRDVEAGERRPSASPVAETAQPPEEHANGGRRNYRLVETTCPVCHFKFQVPWVSSREFRIGQRDGDLRPHYEGEHGLYHAIWACPRCRYAAYRDSFTRVNGDELEQLRKMLAPDPVVDEQAVRTAASPPGWEEAVARHKLAISCYQIRKSPPSVLAGLYHQLAWLYREAGAEEQEKKYLAQALEKYIETFEKGKGKFPAQLGEPGVLYLAGEISRRLGNYREAARWLEKAIRHPEIKQHPLVSELARDRWAEVREGLHGEQGR